jgi:hypothetical protein
MVGLDCVWSFLAIRDFQSKDIHLKGSGLLYLMSHAVQCLGFLENSSMSFLSSFSIDMTLKLKSLEKCLKGTQNAAV